MASLIVTLVTLFWTLFSTACSIPLDLCTQPNIDKVARVAFGEAANQGFKGQLAVAYTIANRAEHPGYPNTVTAVLAAKYNHNGTLIHEYETLDRPDHTVNWNSEKASNSALSREIQRAARAALCKTVPDPTKCAVAFCWPKGCPAIQDNQWWRVHTVTQIGAHWFGCKSRQTG